MPAAIIRVSNADIQCKCIVRGMQEDRNIELAVLVITFARCAFYLYDVNNLFPTFIYIVIYKIFNTIGIQNRQDTLSEQGHPCHHDIHDKSCGWCGLSSQQCNGWNHLYYKNIKCGYLTAYAPGARKRGAGFCLGQGIMLRNVIILATLLHIKIIDIDICTKF